MNSQKAKIKKNDTVIILAGKDKGKTGKVLQVAISDSRVFVEKINIIKRHIRPSRTSKGGIVEKEGGLHLSKVMLVCPHCEKTSRMGLRAIEADKKLRYCKKCGEILDRG